MAILKKARHFWPFVWGGAALALLAVLVLEHQFGRSTIGEGARAPAKIAQAGLLPPFRLSPEAQAGTETVARPLFVPGRRPAPAAVNTGAGAIKKGQFILQGTTIVGPLSIAMLKEVSSGTVHRVEKGGEIMGMTLAEVSAEQVVLKAGDDSETLLLLVAKASGIATPTVAGTNVPLAVGGAQRATQGNAAAGAVRGVGTVPGPPRVATPESSVMTPEEMIARRRAARRP